jgi:bifunctional non-homologous end joining protein LigD
MLASLADAPLDDPQLVYEPKYDGIRAIAEITPAKVQLWSRLGNEKTQQFPEITAALRAWAQSVMSKKSGRDVIVLDGEIVALDPQGNPTGFQNLQGRIHLSAPRGHSVGRASRPVPQTPAASAGPRASGGRPFAPALPPVAFIAFDLLKEGRTDHREKPLSERRKALVQLFSTARSPVLRISEQVRGDGRALYREALTRGWEGVIAKHAASLYKSGKRTPDWRKVKIVNEQEFVIGGWTEPRHTRSYFGALLLGVYENGPNEREPALTYVGHTGTGFNEKELARVMTLLKARETPVCPFRERPKTNERAHWIRAELVAQIKFTEWTADGKLRHPVYLGLRDDKKATDVHREEAPNRHRAAPSHQMESSGDLIAQLQALEDARRDGVVNLPGGQTLKVTNLSKVFWPKLKLTKGDLFRYYVRVAPALLPVLADRPLVMKRYPNGVTGKPFYQHRATDVPAGVRTEMVQVAERRPHIIGGTLLALLHTTQLAAISQDPWFSRVQHPEQADHVALDLDPSDEVPFSRVLDVARWIRDELEALGARGWPKTSGADGLHIYVPLPPRTPYDAGLLFCQIIATVVAHKHPKAATVERSVAARGKRVYIDFLQNILGKTLASAYSARASEYAGVSAPLSWDEVEAGVDRRDFTIQTVPRRLQEKTDLWKGLLTSRGVDLTRVTKLIK